MSEQDVRAATDAARQRAEEHQRQGRGTFVPEAHASQLPGRADVKDPGNMGNPKGAGQ